MNVMVEAKPGAGGWSVDTSRGSCVTTVNDQWRSRGPDERHVCMSDLIGYLEARNAGAQSVTLTAADLDVIAEKAGLLITADGKGLNPAAPTHWAMRQLCQKAARAPLEWLARLRADKAADNLRTGLRMADDAPFMLYNRGLVVPTLAAVTSPSYGRISDLDVALMMRDLVGEGTGDTDWKVPGRLDWSTMTYQPFPLGGITSDSTTLYAGPESMFLFFVEDRRPIVIGTLPDGNPDIYFRGMYIGNSEVGKKTLSCGTMFLRGACENRCLWGCEEVDEISMRHTALAPSRFVAEIAPALRRYALSSGDGFVRSVSAAKKLVVADTDADAKRFLLGQGFGKAHAERIVQKVRDEQHTDPRTLAHLWNGITADARDIPYADDRLAQEKLAQNLLRRVA